LHREPLYPGEKIILSYYGNRTRQSQTATFYKQITLTKIQNGFSAM
jgi:hypothetical protein